MDAPRPAPLMAADETPLFASCHALPCRAAKPRPAAGPRKIRRRSRDAQQQLQRDSIRAALEGRPRACSFRVPPASSAREGSLLRALSARKDSCYLADVVASPLVFVAGDYVIGKRIAQGHGPDAATVFLGHHKDSDKEKVVVKVFRKANAKVEKRIRKECSILRAMQGHPHIVKLHAVIENASHVCLVMQHAEGGDLFDYVRRMGDGKRGLDPLEAQRIFKQIISAVHHMHRNGYIHRDLKLENVFLGSNDEVLLGDFGFATTWSSFKRKHKGYGSPYYISPELLTLSKGYIGPEVDIWSLGVCLYALLAGSTPYESARRSRRRRSGPQSAFAHGHTQQQQQQDSGITDWLRSLKDGKTPTHWHVGRDSETPSVLMPDAEDLLNKMLRFDPLKRATMLDVFNHDWVKKTPMTSASVVDIFPQSTSSDGLRVYTPKADGIFIRVDPAKQQQQQQPPPPKKADDREQEKSAATDGKGLLSPSTMCNIKQQKKNPIQRTAAFLRAGGKSRTHDETAMRKAANGRRSSDKGKRRRKGSEDGGLLKRKRRGLSCIIEEEGEGQQPSFVRRVGSDPNVMLASRACPSPPPSSRENEEAEKERGSKPAGRL